MRFCECLAVATMVARYVSRTIDRKSFSCCFDRNYKGRVVRITETHLKRGFSLFAEEIILVWISDSIDDLLLSPNTHNFFRKSDCNNGFIWIQKVSNKRGCFIEITKVINSGGKHNLVVPAGEEFRGWRDFADLLREFLNCPEGENHKQISQKVKEGTSYAEIVRTHSNSSNKDMFIKEKENENLCLEQKTYQSEVREIDWKEVIVITKRDFHDDWGRILEILQEQVREPFIINPFQPNKALLKCPSRDMANLLYQNKDWVSFGPIILKTEKWDPQKHGRINVITIVWRMGQNSKHSPPLMATESF